MTKPLRILYEGTAYSAQARGGITRYFNELLPQLAEVRPDWTLLLQVASPVLAQLPPSAAVRVKRVPRLRPSMAALPANLVLRAATAIASRPDVFHGTLGRPMRALRCPLVATIHDVLELALPRVFPSLDRSARWKYWNAKHCDMVLTVSETSRRDIIERLGASSQRVRAIYPGVGSLFTRPTEDEITKFRDARALERPFALFVGHRGQHKNFSILAEAFRRTRPGGLQLVVVGGEPAQEGDALASLVRLGWARHEPAPTDRDLAYYYAASSVYVFPSLYEGFGFPLVEALACGAVVLASDIPTSKEIAGSACEYFDPASAEDLGSKMERLLQSSTAAQSARQTGPATAARYSWKGCASRIASAYEELVGA
jgi:glycosyltransferase involved in cell wall biosynthesis